MHIILKVLQCNNWISKNVENLYGTLTLPPSPFFRTKCLATFLLLKQIFSHFRSLLYFCIPVRSLLYFCLPVRSLLWFLSPCPLFDIRVHTSLQYNMTYRTRRTYVMFVVYSKWYTYIYMKPKVVLFTNICNFVYRIEGSDNCRSTCTIYKEWCLP